tara:strand:- start:368 stop:1003 length:636 start_codon:yes stop_codon:yes gene_type:complete
MSISLTINDINNLTKKEKDVLAMLASDSVGMRTETSLSMEVPDIMDNIEPLNISIEPVLSSVEEQPTHQLGDNYIICTGRQGASVFGLKRLKDFSNFVRSGIPFVQKIGYNKYAIDQRLLEDARCSLDEIESFKQGEELKFPAWMTIREMHKSFRKAGLNLKIKVSHGSKTIYGADVYNFPGSGAHQRRLINPRGWKASRPTFYGAIKKAL